VRILLVSHLFPPRNTAGTEVYTAELGRQLIAAGHEVEVFCTDKDVGRPDGELVERELDGMRVNELTSNLYLDSFRETWDRVAAEAPFEGVLRRFRPDVVHFHHLMYMSSSLLALARGAGARVVMTLHDFWLECPRMGQLLHADGSVCHTVEPERCAACLSSFEWRQSRLERSVGRALGGVRRVTGVDLAGLARDAARLLPRGARGGKSSEQESSEMAAEVLARREELRTRCIQNVAHFIAPSEFLRDRLVAWGLPAERVHHLPTGIDASAFTRAEAAGTAAPERLLRVVFLGTLVPVKGADVLLEAWGLLTPEQRGRAELKVYGPGNHAPEHVASLERRARELRVELPGPLARSEVPAVLARADLVVVPSVWFENRPLVVLEALATGTPLLVSEPGGMSELVREGIDGWRFPMGDARALAERLGLVIDSPASLAELRVGGELPSWEALTESVLELYRG